MNRLAQTILLLAGVFLFISSVGCGDTQPDSTGQKRIVDALDRSVEIPPQIERIVTLAPGVTEIVAAAGGLEKIAGVSTADNFPPSVSELPKFSALPVNYEAVAALEPDIIFATTQVNNVRDSNVFSTLNIPIVYLASSSLDEVLESIQVVGSILGTGTVANRTIASLQTRLDILKEATDQIGSRPNVLFLISAQALHSFGPESYIHEVIAMAGGTSSTASVDVRNPILSDEFVLTQNPDIIVGTFGDSFQPEQLLDHHPTWTLLTAVKNRHVYSMESDIVLRAGPRIVDATERLFSLIHPEQNREINSDQ